VSIRSFWMTFLALAVTVGLASPVWAGHKQKSANTTPPPPPPVQTPPPATEPSAASVDKAADAAALATLTAAKQALQDLTDQKWAAFQQTPDWSTAQTNLDGIKSDLDAAKKAAADSLTTNADYQAALAAKQKAADDIAALRASGDATPETLSPLANASLQANIKIRQLQSDLIANDPGIQATADKLTAAQHSLDLLKRDFQNGLSADKDYLADKTAVDVAQKNYDDAHAKLAADIGN